MRTAACTARDTARHNRSPAAISTAPAKTATRCAMSIAAAGGAAAAWLWPEVASIRCPMS